MSRRKLTKTEAIEQRCELTIADLKEMNIWLAEICPYCDVDVAWHMRGQDLETLHILNNRQSKDVFMNILIIYNLFFNLISVAASSTQSPINAPAASTQYERQPISLIPRGG